MTPRAIPGVADLILIEADERHRGYVLSTWVHDALDMRRGRGWPERPTAAGVRQLAEILFPRVLVAVRPGAHETAHGWICAEEGALFHVYVPFDLRPTHLTSAMVRAVVGEMRP